MAEAPSPYSPHPGLAMKGVAMNKLKETTGKSGEEWQRELEAASITDRAAAVAWLRDRGLGARAAMIVAQSALGGDDYRSPEAMVDAMYAGKKAHLRPIHEALVGLGLALGPELRICVGKTIVPFYRRHVVAEIKPATLTRIDFGLALRTAGREPPLRLLPTGGLGRGDRITHRIPIAKVADVDDEVERWLRIAFDADA